MQGIIKMLDNVINNSYSPYSDCKVGCVLDFGNQFICGTNVENASYGLSMCAERSALFSAVANGIDLDLLQNLYIKSNKSAFFTPCGACLQVLSEFVKGDLNIFVLNNNNDIMQYKFSDLMPMRFDKSKLN